jgi:hypothetical protein
MASPAELAALDALGFIAFAVAIGCLGYRAGIAKRTLWEYTPEVGKTL